MSHLFFLLLQTYLELTSSASRNMFVTVIVRFTWDILYDISYKCTEVTTNVLQCVRVFVIFSLKQLPGEINILKQCAVQRVALSI